MQADPCKQQYVSDCTQSVKLNAEASVGPNVLMLAVKLLSSLQRFSHSFHAAASMLRDKAHMHCELFDEVP